MDTLFDDGKEAGALRTIGEVSEALGIKTHVLRYWEQQFPMLDPLKRSGGRRYYRTEDVALVQEIDRLVNREGYTLKGAEKALKEGSSPSLSIAPENDDEEQAAGRDGARDRPSYEAEPVKAVSGETLARLKSLRVTLADALAR